MSYGALAAYARAIAGALADVAPPGERALLLFPPGVDFVAGFFGCLYAGALAVPVYPPRSIDDRARLDGIAASAAPRVVLSTRAFLARIEPLLAGVRALAGVPRVAIDDLPTCAWTPPRLEPASLAFLQYTSGSTGRPRGVMVPGHGASEAPHDRRPHTAARGARRRPPRDRELPARARRLTTTVPASGSPAAPRSGWSPASRRSSPARA